MVVTIPGVGWEALARSKHPTIRGLLASSTLANVSVRVSNRPADAYATLGAGVRMHVIPSAGWAFEVSETVENGTAAALFGRRTGTPAPSEGIVVPAIDQIARANTGRAFGGRAGALAEALDEAGTSIAVVGNGDHSRGGLPAVLPDQEVMGSEDPPEVGIHREVALVGISPDGTGEGMVGRSLLRKDDDSPLGLRTDLDTLTTAVSELWPRHGVVVVDIGDTARADIAAIRQPENADRWRDLGLDIAGEALARLMPMIDPARDTLVVVAPVTPGGPDARGRLRPAIIHGEGWPSGLGATNSTRTKGSVTMPDLTATIAYRAGASSERFGSGRAIGVVADDDPLGQVVAMDRDAARHDGARVPFALAAVGLFTVGAVRWRLRGKGQVFGLAAWLLVPSTYLTQVIEMPVVFIVMVPFIAAGAGAHLLRRTVEEHAFRVALALTTAVLVLDLFAGSAGQLDSLLGYTSTAAGRYFGLGNLGFAVAATSTLIIAATAKARPWVSTMALLVGLVVIGHPSLGDDFGGVIAFVPGVLAVLWWMSSKRQVQIKWIPVFLVAGIAAVLLFGVVDLSRPPAQRTHIGDLLAAVIDDPAQLWLIVQRKALVALTVGVTNAWTAAVPGALMVVTHAARRLPGGAMVAVYLVAAIGAAINDSGLAVAGLMLALTASYEMAQRRVATTVP